MANGTNVLFILSDEHRRDVMCSYGNSIVQTPNLDRIAASGTRFDSAYTTCPICIPARASLATGRYVHEIGYWDNGIPYDGRHASWHHELRGQGRVVDSIGKLHFKGQGCDHGFRHEMEALHVVDGVGDILGCIRDDPPRRHKRPGIEEAGPGDSSYLRYDDGNADRACRWLREHADDEEPWVLQVGFVLPHPPYIAPPDCCERYPIEAIEMPAQWREADWPRHPVMEHFRWFFDFDRPFTERTIRELVVAYYGAVTFLDYQIGRIMNTLSELGLSNNTMVIYSSDHGESMGARGIFGKFTMYEESVAVPLLVAGPGVTAGAVCDAPVSLVDLYPTILEAAGVSDERLAQLMADRPGRSLLRTAAQPDPDRPVLSEYHAVGSRHGYYLLRYLNWKYVHYVDAPPQLFRLGEDPQEINELAGAAVPSTTGILEQLRVMLSGILDPADTDRRARRAQSREIERHGGRQRVIERGAFDNSPVPGEEAEFHG